MAIAPKDCVRTRGDLLVEFHKRVLHLLAFHKKRRVRFGSSEITMELAQHLHDLRHELLTRKYGLVIRTYVGNDVCQRHDTAISSYGERREEVTARSSQNGEVLAFALQRKLYCS